MALYKYKAISAEGRTIEGIYEAGSQDAVLVMLRQNQYYPIRVKEKKTGKDIDLKKLFFRIHIKHIAVFCRQFQTMLAAGVSLISCLDILRQQTENKSFRAVIADVYEKVQQGLTLSEAMRKHEEAFPELLINMVLAGEASGNLDVILDRMASHYEKENKLRNKIKGAMIYPTILAVIAFLVVIFLLVFVVPQFIGMFESSGVPLPLPTRILLTISRFLTSYWYVVAAVAALAIIAIKMLLKNENIRLIVDSYKFKIPIIKGINQKVITSRFARTLATLLSSGMPLLQSMDKVGKIVNNRVVEQGIDKAKEDIRRGVQLSVPIRDMGIFPPMMASMISIGEEAGALDEILEKTADYYNEEAEAALDMMTRMIEPLMLVVMALLIGSIIVATILPMLDMMTTVTM